MSSTFDEPFQNTLLITMRRGRTFRWERTRLADGQSNNSETLSRIQSLADYTIDTLESSFQKRQVHERAALLYLNLVDEGLSRLDVRLRHAADPVHAVRQQHAVPVGR